MTKLNWDAIGKRLFSVGVDRGVFYPTDTAGVSWDGLIAVQETPNESDLVEKHYDGKKFFSTQGAGSFAATIEAYSYPPEFESYAGTIGMYSNQIRKAFNFSYRTLLGNDSDGIDHGYLIHLVYNATAAPSNLTYQSENSSIEITTFSWDISTAPIKIGETYGSHLIVDTRFAYSWAVEALEELLYGNGINAPALPDPQYIIDLFDDASILKITDHGDGTWTAEGPDDAIKMLDSTSFEITWPSAVYIDNESYKISSL